MKEVINIYCAAVQIVHVLHSENSNLFIKNKKHAFSFNFNEFHHIH